VSDVEQRVLRFVWEQSPDQAVESGFLPPRLWEDVTADAKWRAHEEAKELRSAVARASLNSVERLAAQYHVYCADFVSSSPSVCLLNHMTGPVGRLGWAAWSWPLAADPSCDIYVERLEHFSTYCEALLRRIQEEPETPQYSAVPVLSAFVAQVDAFVDAERGGDGTLFLPLTAARARGASVKSPRSGLLEDVLRSSLALRQAAVEQAKSAQPVSPFSHAEDGAERYAAAVHYGTSADMGPEEIERLGRIILSRSDRRFQELSESGTVNMACPGTAEELMDDFRAAYGKIAEVLPSVTPVQPAMGCQIVPMPGEHAATGPPAFYGPSSLRNSRVGSLYVNTALPIRTRAWEVLPLTLHEGIPGHHLQLSLVDEDRDLSALLRVLSVNALTEGWAVYAETLASDMGLSIPPTEEFGLLAYQRWRAARLVVDVGLHVHGWSVDEATGFLSDKTRQDPELVRREVVRYLAWPAQALGYSIGAQVVTDWVKARRNQGASLPTAHKELFSMGSVPLSALRSSADT
jgi:uncharacterized protein (DUF885 family)